MSAVAMSCHPGISILVSDSGMWRFDHEGRKLGLESRPYAKTHPFPGGVLAQTGLLWPVDFSTFPGRRGGTAWLRKAFAALPDDFRAGADRALLSQGTPIKYIQSVYAVETGPTATEWELSGTYTGGLDDIDMRPLKPTGAAWRFYDNEPDPATVGAALSFPKGDFDADTAAQIIRTAWNRLFEAAECVKPYTAFAATSGRIFEPCDLQIQ